MSDALNSAELAAQHAELLPARTVLSMLHPGGIDVGPVGQPGAAGENGKSSPTIDMMELLTRESEHLMLGTTNGQPA